LRALPTAPGWKRSRDEGRKEGREETARNRIQLGVLSVGQIAQATGLSIEQIEALRGAESERS
jgi:predicted transposase YdaD